MTTVLGQEVIRYNRLLKVINTTLRDLLKAIKGLVVMSSELDTMANRLYDSIIFLGDFICFVCYFCKIWCPACGWIKLTRP